MSLPHMATACGELVLYDLKCAVCGASATEVTWGQQLAQGEGAAQPIGDGCKECMDCALTRWPQKPWASCVANASDRARIIDMKRVRQQRTDDKDFIPKRVSSVGRTTWLRNYSTTQIPNCFRGGASQPASQRMYLSVGNCVVVVLSQT